MGEDIVIVSAVRTPIGRYGGAFKEISSGHLASIAIKEAIKRANIERNKWMKLFSGEVRQTTESSNVARVAALAFRDS